MDTKPDQASASDTAKAQFVNLVSSDEHEFFVARDKAIVPDTIKNMLAGPGEFSEKEHNEVAFREIPSHVLERVCIYLYYKKRYENHNKEVPDFHIDPSIVLDLLMAANFLST
ncbi:uncharacterized protein MONBRDRAFT_32565 [Monosiga brevicollis MX1]|uniref:Elongin-C n=1 Tax=Monosiga brevicollis TaxID=81824 RepID=A9V0C5_MONBE|nr:uncharacterized protein MONBRDRAFT_32565 [Monosiga brevicollis MX1]EDQ89133.1 predicted protein [Monosiga brevicollis MX1]|eukprot:XP_001746238.1 hypothetical protein [Monosiga brevicollis MX1]